MALSILDKLITNTTTKTLFQSYDPSLNPSFGKTLEFFKLLLTISDINLKRTPNTN